jgi:hypothetical protein
MSHKKYNSMKRDALSKFSLMVLIESVVLCPVLCESCKGVD